MCQIEETPQRRYLAECFPESESEEQVLGFDIQMPLIQVDWEKGYKFMTEPYLFFLLSFFSFFSFYLFSFFCYGALGLVGNRKSKHNLLEVVYEGK